MVRGIVFVAAVLACFMSFVSADEDSVSGCGGFIKSSRKISGEGKKKFDLAKSVSVKLVTDKGHVKYTTECSPNGYYFIPVYDRGNFTIRIDGPDGWSFEPKSAQVHITDNGQCNDGEDVNFLFTGFTLSGQVVDSNSKTGPAGVTLKLKSQDSKDNFYSETKTKEGGSYSFPNLYPGKYIVVASHLAWSFETREVKVTMPADQHVVSTDIVVAGYDVSGRVISGSDPVPDVAFLLYSKTVKSLKCKKVGGSHSSQGLKPLCQGVSGSDGKFSISGLPNGKYFIEPYYKTPKTAYEVSPSHQEFEIQTGSFVFEDAFRVTGFSVSGKVVDVKGQGVSGAKIYLDNTEKATTDKSGAYRLDGVSAGKYTIEASKDHMVFESLVDHVISSRNPEMPSLAVTKLDLCGTWTMKNGQGSKREFLLTDSVGDQQRTTADSSGRYCFQVAPGPYTVMAVLSNEERQAGLLLSPPQHAVTITTAPFLKADFQQSLVRVLGTVNCLDKCDSDIEIVLTPQGSGKSATTKLSPSGKKGEFEFSNVHPGAYEVSVSHDPYCWKETSFEIKVSTQNVEGIDFTQKGFYLHATVPHEIEVDISPSKGKATKHTFAPGTNRVCLEKQGVYSLSQQSCYRFEDEVTKFDTARPKPIEYKVSHYLVNGTITAVHDSKKDVDIAVNVRVLEGTESESVIKAERVKSEGSNHNYRYHHWAKSGDVIEIVPVSPILLFYPRDLKYTVNTRDGCPAPVQVLEARPGLFIQGSVSPKEAGVEVSVIASETSDVIRSVMTNKEGKYEIGPLHDDQEFTMRATKPGYHFEQTDKLPKNSQGKRHLSCSFRSVKLGSVEVLVTDESGKPLSDVSLSLSGDEYRSNKKTDAKGAHQFTELFPGQYFLRPQSSEYKFKPTTIDVTVQEGKASDLKVTGKRFAYSCFGSVRSLTGEPEKHVTIEAVPATETESYQESSTDAEGNFRIRGLVPNVQYTVRVKTGSENRRLERASPESHTVTIKDDDVHSVSFVAFRRVPKFELTGQVKTSSEEILDTVTVELFLSKEKGQSDRKAVRSVTLSPQTTFFHFFGLPRDDYTLIVSSSLSTVTHVHKATELQVSKDADSPIHFDIPFEVLTKKLATEVSGSNSAAMVIGLLGLLAFFYRQQLIQKVRQMNKPTPGAGVPEQRFDDGLIRGQKSRGGKRK